MLSFGSYRRDLFRDVSAMMESLGLLVVEVSQDKEKGSTNMRVVLTKEGSDITTDDLEAAYNVLYPMYQVVCENRDLNLEVSSPGLQRNLKDYSEFRVFKGRDVRVYSTEYSSYVSGKIVDSDDSSLVLGAYLIEDKKESGESITLKFDTIAKAKLECRWEEKKK